MTEPTSIKPSSRPRRPSTRLSRPGRAKNPGASLYNRVYSKRNPQKLSEASDVALLSLLIGPVAARSVIEHIGSLEHYTKIGSGAQLLDHPGISKATAVRLDALYEISARIG